MIYHSNKRRSNIMEVVIDSRETSPNKNSKKNTTNNMKFFMRTKTLLLKKHPGGQSTFITRRCKWCGKIFFKKHNRETYCSSKCKKYAHQEQKAIWIVNPEWEEL